MAFSLSAFEAFLLASVSLAHRSYISMESVDLGLGVGELRGSGASAETS